MTNKQNWISDYESPLWNSECVKLLIDGSTDGEIALKPKLEEILENSNKFPLKFPSDETRCKTLLSTIDKNILKRNIESAYPLIHELAFNLCAEFILYKRKHGTEIEKAVYENLNLLQFIDRILRKKAAAFVDPAYDFILADGQQGNGDWSTVGTVQETSPLILKNCLSYDEMKLSAFVSIASYSYFINNGSRKSHGKVEENRNEIQNEGVIISLIGPKFTMRNLYERQDIIISPKDENSNLSALFSKFYQEPKFIYKDARKLCKYGNERFSLVRNDEIFDNVIYAKRLSITFDTFLLEAVQRAKEKETTAYIHLVGVGLGVWIASSHQEKIFVETFGNRLCILEDKLNYISDIHLAYFTKTQNILGFKNGEIFPAPGHSSGIKVHISNREPFTKIQKIEDKDKLLMVSYAADGNSLPGNEYWKGFLGNSSDSATASSSQVAELHNPHINPVVRAANLRVATCAGALIPIQEYVAHVQNVSGGENEFTARKRKTHTSLMPYMLQ